MSQKRVYQFEDFSLGYWGYLISSSMIWACVPADITDEERSEQWAVIKQVEAALNKNRKVLSHDDQRQMMRSQNDANLTKAYMDTFSRPSIAKYL